MENQVTYDTETYLFAPLTILDECTNILQGSRLLVRQRNAGIAVWFTNKKGLTLIRMPYLPKKAVNWYDLFVEQSYLVQKDLNSGKMYSNLEDVKSISRSKQAGMKVLLDFHLSDSWADPKNNLVPASWANVVGNTDVLKTLFTIIFTIR